MQSQPVNPKSGERIAKVIARAGLASRREAEEWIAAGRIAVNGAVIGSPALNVTARDRISVDGEPLPARERTRLFLYHKPRGLMTTHADPQGRPTIFESLPRDLPRLISVGRLDFNTEGLLLLTNDGALARVLELPATGWLRRYRVRAHGSIAQARLDELRAGITISGIHYGPIEASLDRVQGSNVWLSLAIREGKNREVRNVLSHLGLTVTRLIRVSFGPFQLGELAEGAIEEVRTRVLREQLGEKLVRLCGADFSAARAPPRPSRERDDAQQRAAPPRPTPKPANGKPKKRNSSAHAWRAHEEDRPAKKLRRIFRGSRRDKPERQPPAGEARAEVLTDRKGRPVAVERYGRPAVSQAPRQDWSRTDEPRLHRKRAPRHRRAPDRAAGPRAQRPNPGRPSPPRPRGGR
ncbi:MAG TPA: pseudouridine synthase [Xanthobacteraceae bacterium]|nr:pseudouridine synthase [Xanthobacteraceae bacterium]